MFPRVALSDFSREAFLDVVTALSDLIDSIAWPLVVLIVFFKLRESIAERIGNLRSLTGRGIRAEFDRQVRDVEERSQDAIDEEYETPAASPPSGPALDLVQSYPRGAVLESWLAVERELREAIIRSGIALSPRATTRQIVAALERERILGAGMAAIIRDLHALRNKAAHTTDFELSVDSAESYISAASMVAAALERVAPDDGSASEEVV